MTTLARLTDDERRRWAGALMELRACEIAKDTTMADAQRAVRAYHDMQVEVCQAYDLWDEESWIVDPSNGLITDRE